MTLFVAAFVSCAAIAQDKMNNAIAPSSPRPNTVEAATHYWCPECDFQAIRPAQCPNHKVALVQEGMFYCKGDSKNATAVAGKCADGTPMMKMDRAEKMKARMNNNNPLVDPGKPAEEKK
jgi:hypothetical protein